MPDAGPIRLDLMAESLALQAARRRMLEIANALGFNADSPVGPTTEAMVESISVAGSPDVIRAALDVARAAVDRLEDIASRYPSGSPERRAVAIYLNMLRVASDDLVKPFADLARWHKAQSAGKPEGN